MTQKTRYLTKVALAFSLSLLIMFLLVLPGKATAQDWDRDEAYRVENFSLSGGGSLDVRTSGGHITVEGSDGDEIRVEMYVTQRGKHLLPEDTDLEDFDITIEQSGSRITATAEGSRNDWRFWRNNNLSISFVVYTPRDMQSTLRTSGGHITVSGLNGRQEVRTSGGHLELNDLMGEVEARTSGGHIEIARFEGTMSARTSGGHISAENANGVIDLHTSGGHIELADVGGTVEARTSGGSIEADLDSINESVDLRTSGGHITITVPGDRGYNLALRGSRVRSQLTNFSGEVERDEIDGSINGGGPQITARTSGGTVRLNFRR
ncbi:MAG: DUF4097 family beta strand repeat-containing protein [Balneolaceae bacterium]|nr:DUF4097 family beta strand repeat-containing protein [Balneolaceae bacterium]